MYHNTNLLTCPNLQTTGNSLTDIKPEIRKNICRAMIQLAVNSLEGKEIKEGALETLQAQMGSLDHVNQAYSGIFSFTQWFLKLPQGSINVESFKEHMQEIKFPEECVTDFMNTLFGSKGLALSNKMARNTFFSKLNGLRWRIDITISSSVLSRVLEPSILCEMQLNNGSKKTFEVSISKFHHLRYTVASVLKEMETMQKKKLVKNIKQEQK